MNDPSLVGQGIWAPGVSLMRRLRFLPKMGLLMTLMGLGFVWPTGAYIHEQWTNIEFSEKERAGVKLLEALYPALTAALNVRRDVTARARLLIDAEAFERSGRAGASGSRQSGGEVDGRWRSGDADAPTASVDRAAAIDRSMRRACV